MHLHNFVPFIIIAFLTACGSEGANSESQGDTVLNTFSVTESVAALNLGSTTWESDCFRVENSNPESSSDEATYQRFVFEFAADSTSYDIEAHIYYLPNETCSGNYDFISTATYSIIIADGITTGSGLSAYPVSEILTEENYKGVWQKTKSTFITRIDNLLYYGAAENGITELNFDEAYRLVE